MDGAWSLWSKLPKDCESSLSLTFFKNSLYKFYTKKLEIEYVLPDGTHYNFLAQKSFYYIYNYYILMYFSDCTRSPMSVGAPCPVSFSCRFLFMYIDLMIATNILSSNSNKSSLRMQSHQITRKNSCGNVVR